MPEDEVAAILSSEQERGGGHGAQQGHGGQGKGMRMGHGKGMGYGQNEA
jgi:hypothetical protein